MYVVCDIALGLLLTRCTNMVWKSSQFEIKLPRTLFVNAPPDFINPDFAQLYKPAAGGALEEGEPRVTFTPAKNARAVKEGLIPPKFLRHKAGTAPNTTPDNGDESKEAFAEAATQQDGVSVVVAPVISKPKKPKLTKKGTTRNQKKRAAKPSKKPLYVPSSSSPQVDLDEEQQQPVSQIAGSKELEIPAAPAATQLSAPDTRSSVTVPVTTGARKRLHSKSSPEVNGPMSVNDFEGLKTVDVTVAVNSKKRKFASPSDPHQAVAVAAADASPNVRSISSPRQANGVRPPIFRQGKLIFQKTARSATRTAAAASPSTKAGAKLRSTAAKSPKTSRRAPTRKPR